MEKTVFNLQKYIKKAFYEDDRGYWNMGSRAWPNCLKSKMDKDKKGPQEAYESCLKEYNEANRAKWLLTYSGGYDDINNPNEDEGTPAALKLKKS
jgi:hypothetical protein